MQYPNRYPPYRPKEKKIETPFLFPLSFVLNLKDYIFFFGFGYGFPLPFLLPTRTRNQANYSTAASSQTPPRRPT